MCKHKRAVLVKGDTKNVKPVLQALEGSWNKGLGGWVFPMKKREEVLAALRQDPTNTINEDPALVAVSQMRVLALELGPQGIRVNTVAPGATETPMIRRMMEGMGFDDAMLKGDMNAFRIGVPLGRIAMPEDIVDATMFLLGQESSFVTGQDIRINGGAGLF